MNRRLQEMIAEEERAQDLVEVLAQDARPQDPVQGLAQEARAQAHVHEFQDSVIIAQVTQNPHNHRFAGVTGQAIYENGSHYHRLEANTDFYEDHFHAITDRTGPARPIGNGKHVHAVAGQTTVSNGHRHQYVFGTLIENPIGE